ncbi:MAG: hypothetical protein J0L99_03715 [Chitinophagales bacterium]|nr:hypothetical protein [Chitinophagales bacterium]
MKQFVSFLCAVWCSLAVLQAQSGGSAPQIFVKGIYHQGELRLRWTPADFGVFQQGNTYGYKVTRQLVARNGQPVSESVRQASTTHFGPFKPLPEVQWDAISDTSDIAGVAQGAIYADDFTVQTNGGDPFYEKAADNMSNENRHSFGLFAADQSFNIAQYMGLALRDQTAGQEAQGTYMYRVVLMSLDSLNRPRGVGIIALTQNNLLPAPQGLEVYASANRVLLYLPRTNLEAHYTSFNMERSTNGGSSWQRRNDKPLLFLSNNAESERMMFQDTLETPGQTYQYRLRGVSPFGISGPPSNAVSAVAKTPALGVYPELTSINEVNGQFQLNWNFPAQKESELLKMQVMRSDRAEGEFTVLGDLPVSARSYSDPAPLASSNYYKVVALDKGNNPNESLVKLSQLSDNQAPNTPGGLTAQVDEKGLVKLSWTKNTEADLSGYRLFYSNSPDGDFSPLYGYVITENKFEHQLELKVLGKKVYYKILATDLRENDSPLSAAVFVDRPDVIPPARPVLNKVDPMPIGVILQWTKSSSDDVVRHEVQRQVRSATSWQTVATFPQSSPTVQMIDSSHTGTSEYSYRILAFDQGGLASSSSVIDVKPSRTNIDTIMEFKVFTAVEGMQKQAKLQWEYKGDSEAGEFHIYRGKASGQPIFYAMQKIKKEDIVIDPITKRATFFYRDKTIDPGESYRYRVLAKFPDGSSSPLSAPVPFVY